MKFPTLSLVLVRSLLLVAAAAEVPPEAPRQGAALLKTDIMGVFAHPDDETGVAGTLAFYALGKGAVIANVYCTRGEGGGNMVGTQSGAALGVLREAELRDCLGGLGVRYCYFLDQLDWAYTESAAATLRKWGKEETLGRLVRMIRTLRPEVILTMNPAPAPGQHGHHQAAGILAIEAFDAAADPGRFPEQLSKEGLGLWQPRKVYYGGREGPVLTRIELDAALPGGKLLGQTAAGALANHRSQGFGNFRASLSPLRPQSFVLVKSVLALIPGETDLLAGLPIPGDLPAKTAASLSQEEKPPLVLAFVPRPAIAQYLAWMNTQGIGHLGSRFPADLPLVAGEAGEVRLELANHSDQAITGELHIPAPEGWLVETATRRLTLPPRTVIAEKIRFTPPAGKLGDGNLKAVFTGASSKTIEAAAIGHAVPMAKILRTPHPPALNGSSDGWEPAVELAIPAAQLVQGTVVDENDSSARCRLLVSGETLFIDVEVMDDVVVSNIGPNDIKGHWRSDSVEICLDPAAGAEDTMGCYKLGIFPFDTTGKVRAARDADANQGPVEVSAPGTRLFSKRTPQGYRLQVAIPFQELGITAEHGKRLGFNLIVYDGDEVGAALGANINQSRIAWSPRSGVQGRPEDWGRVELE